MNIQKVKQGAKITMYNGIYMILFGLFYIIFVQYNMRKSFQAVSGIWKLFAKYNPQIATLFVLLNIIIGICLISMGIVVIYLSYFIVKRKEKISWIILFLSGIIGWCGFLLISFLMKNPLLITLSLLGWLSFVIGVFLPIKYYLQKDYREY
jgi:uncharacterized membrane protein HdeD (DUF308 family)